VVLTHMKSPRAASIETLQAAFAEYAPAVHVYVAEESAKAIDSALALAERDDLVCIAGSLYLAAEALRWAAQHGDATAASEIEGIDH